MSRDNILNIKAGRDVTVDALAVGDGARAVAIRSEAAEALAGHFTEIRTVFDELESSGQLTPVAAKLLREETDDVQKTAEASLEDEAQKETLALKLKRLGSSAQSFCTSNEKVFKCLESIAACCAIPMTLLGFGG